jgi:hypothetical protein
MTLLRNQLISIEQINQYTAINENLRGQYEPPPIHWTLIYWETVL